jgi:WD40 repeat protein
MATSVPDQESPRAHDVFISYSRKDKKFVRRLDEALQTRGREAWVDWEGIRPTEEFMQAIYGAIEGADTFVFVLTPDSIASEVCGREIAHAATHNKRMVPIVARDVDAKVVPESLAKLNWIFSRETDDFEAAAASLVRALDLDLDWVHAHTRLLTRALEWEANKKSNSFALRGEDLRSAEQWLAQAGIEKERQPTALQTEYIIASRKASSKRQRIVLGAVTLGALVAVVLAVLAWMQRAEAEKQRAEAVKEEKIASANAAEAARQEGIAKDKAREANEALSQSDFAQGTELVASRREGEALAHFARAVRLTSHSAAATSLVSLLIDHVWAIPRAEQNQSDAESAFYSSDGERVVVVLPDGSGELRDVRTSRAIAPIPYQRVLLEVEFSPDGSRLLTLGNDLDPALKSEERAEDYEVRLWEAATGRPLGKSYKTSDSTIRILYSPDNRWVAFGDHTGTRIWNANNGRELLAIAESELGAFSGDGERFMDRVKSGHSVRLWQVATGKQIETALRLPPTNIAVAPNGWQPGFITLNGKAPVKKSGPGEIEEEATRTEFSADGRWVLTFTPAGAQVWDVASGKPLGGLLRSPTAEKIYTASFSPEGARVLTASRDGSICIWEAATSKLLAQGHSPDLANFPTPHEGGFDLTAGADEGSRCHARFSADGRSVITTTEDGRQRHVWDVLGAGAIPLELVGKGAGLYGFSLLTLELEDKVRVWDIRSAQVLAEASYDFAELGYRNAFSRAGGRRVFLPFQTSIRVLDVPTGRELPSFDVSGIESVPDPFDRPDVSLDGSKALYSLTPPTVRNVETGAVICQLSSNDDADMASACLSSDGSLAATSSSSGTVRIWTATTGQAQSTFAPNVGLIKDLRFTPDSQKLLLASEAGTMVAVQLWDIRTNTRMGDPIVSPVRAPDGDFSLRDGVFNLSGSRFAIIGGDVLQLMDTGSGKAVGLPRYHRDDIASVALSPDGRLLASVDHHSFRLWDADTGDAVVSRTMVETDQVSFSSDSLRLSAAGDIYDVATGARLTNMREINARDDTDDSVDSADNLSPDGCFVVHNSDPALVWDIAPPTGAPAWLADLAEAVAGVRIGQRDGFEDVPDCSARLEELKKSVSLLPQDDRWAQIGRWFLSEPAKRTVRPYSATTVADYARRRLQELIGLQQAVVVLPDDAGIRSQLGIHSLQPEKSAGEARNIVADHETLLATKLEPKNADVWRARAKVLVALRRSAEADVAARKASSLAGSGR